MAFKEDNYYYCTHCGRTDCAFPPFMENKCPYCKEPINKIDITDMLKSENANNWFDLKEETKKQFKENLFNDYISNNPKFNPDLMKKRIEESESCPDYNSKPTISCPYCNSTNTRKISSVGRLFSAGLLGLGSGRLGKQWHCNNCQSDF